jgi:hypothetical protein
MVLYRINAGLHSFLCRLRRKRKSVSIFHAKTAGKTLKPSSG